MSAQSWLGAVLLFITGAGIGIMTDVAISAVMAFSLLLQGR